MAIWNPWHGCHKISPGCFNCYMFRRDAEFEKDSTVVKKTASFSMPVEKNKSGEYKLSDDGFVYTCMTSDFFVEEADKWRKEAWAYIKERSDLRFFIITKRIDRFYVSLPLDWSDGYDNVTICSTCENQQTADRRLPLLIGYPIKHRRVIHEPMLEAIDIGRYLKTGKIEGVICGGESGPDARPLNYEWVLDTRRQCAEHGVSFHFKQTGANFIKDGKQYSIPRKLQEAQAAKAGIDIKGS